jgi:hypothetical protein
MVIVLSITRYVRLGIRAHASGSRAARSPTLALRVFQTKSQCSSKKEADWFGLTANVIAAAWCLGIKAPEKSRNPQQWFSSLSQAQLSTCSLVFSSSFLLSLQLSLLVSMARLLCYYDSDLPIHMPVVAQTTLPSNCARNYTVHLGDTCNSISASHSVST